MASNFDFLKNIDKELYSSILDAEKLFRDEYFTQCCVQLRVYAEKTAKKILGNISSDMTFDDVINCLKDKAQSDFEKEFIEDLFFIKREGNKCAHGEDALSSDTLEAMRRAFEIAINYAYAKKKDDNFLKLQFDETLLITEKPLNQMRLVDKYVELATAQQNELLNIKPDEPDTEIKPEIKPKKKKKELTPVQQRVKEKVKAAKKSLKENVNKKPKKPTKKQKQNKTKKNKALMKFILFMIFVIISLYFLTKMIFFN